MDIALDMEQNGRLSTVAQFDLPILNSFLDVVIGDTRLKYDMIKDEESFRSTAERMERGYEPMEAQHLTNHGFDTQRNAELYEETGMETNSYSASTGMSDGICRSKASAVGRSTSTPSIGFSLITFRETVRNEANWSTGVDFSRLRWTHVWLWRCLYAERSADLSWRKTIFSASVEPISDSQSAKDPSHLSTIPCSAFITTVRGTKEPAGGVPVSSAKPSYFGGLRTYQRRAAWAYFCWRIDEPNGAGCFLGCHQKLRS